jgi:hypothetical protein
MPPPSSPLWSAVQAVHDPWPPDDETVARAVGGAWRRGGEVVAQGARDTTAASRLVMWSDPSGLAYQGQVDRYAQAASEVEQRMVAIAERGEHYAGELESAKSTITGTIAANEGFYALLGDPLLGPLGPALQAEFAGLIATYLRGMIAEKAAALRANPAGAPLPAQAPPPPPPEEWTLFDGLADGVRALGQFDQAVAQWTGDLYDGALDGIGQFGAGVVGWAGDTTGIQFLNEVADGFQGTADALGNWTAENYLALGGISQDVANDMATVIDGDKVPHVVIIDSGRYPESAAHIDAAQDGTRYRGHEIISTNTTYPSPLTIDRSGAKSNRSASLQGVPTEAGYDRDEYPPAVFKEGGAEASVKYINPSDNRGAGASMGYQINHALIGDAEDSVDRQTVRLDDGEQVIIVTK